MRTTISSLLILVAIAACGDSSGPAARLPASFQVIAGAAQVDTVGRELKDMVALRVIASDGVTPVPSYPISWTALDGGQVFAAVVNSGIDGIARQRWTLGTGAGSQRLVARALDPETGTVLVDDTVTAMAMPDVAARLSLSRDGIGQMRAGDSLAVQLNFRDTYGNNNAPCADGGPWTRLIWISLDSAIAIPTGQAWISGNQRFGWIRGVSAGSTTIRATAAASCVSLQSSDATTVDVTP